MPNIKTAPEAFEAFLDKDSEHLFTKYRVYNEREIEAIYHIDMENYVKQVDIEARIRKDMALTLYLPSAVAYLNELTQTVNGLKATLGKGDKSVKSLTAFTKSVALLVSKLQTEVVALDKAIATARKTDDIKKKGAAYLLVRKQGDALRQVVDDLEELVADNLWPVPKYRDMIVGL